MELPFNTVYSKDILGNQIETPVADWPTKRAWVDYAFDELPAAGYTRLQRLHAGQRPEQSELQLSRQPVARLATCWPPAWPASGTSRACTIRTSRSGATTSATCWSAATCRCSAALRPTPHQLLVREMILQLKKGQLDAGYFRNKFGVDILDEWRDEWLAHQGRRHAHDQRRPDRADAAGPAARRCACCPRFSSRSIAACDTPERQMRPRYS